jgi:hypothetical protein
MRFVDGRHGGRQALTEIAIIDAAKYKSHRETGAPVSTGIGRFRALIDTGATDTMITRRVVSSLGLEPVNRLPFQSAEGRKWRTGYLFHVAFYGANPSTGDSEEDGVPRYHTIFTWPKSINGGEIDDEPSFDVLLGMDIISTGDLSIKKDGTFRFEF